MIFKPSQLQLWHMLPIAIGLHGLLFALPLPSIDTEAETPKSEESVNVVNLPKPSPSAIASPTPNPTPKVQPSPKVQSPPAATLTPQQTVQPQQQVTPSPTTTPSPTDAIQIIGATPGCRGKLGCWTLPNSNGRTVAGNLEHHLEKQGFTLTNLEVDPDTAFRVYEVAKDGVKQYYLHMIWSDRGTAYVRDANQLSFDQLVAVTQL